MSDIAGICIIAGMFWLISPLAILLGSDLSGIRPSKKARILTIAFGPITTPLWIISTILYGMYMMFRDVIQDKYWD